MLQEFLDKIGIVVASFFATDAARHLIQHAAEPSRNHYEGTNTKNGTDPLESGERSPTNDIDNAGTIIASEESRSKVPVILTQNGINYEQEQSHAKYGSITMHMPATQNDYARTFLSSSKASLCASFTMTLAVIPASLVMIVVLYLDVNTSSICNLHAMNNTLLPRKVMKFVIVGHDVEGVALNTWFQSMLILLFGWEQFKRHYFSTLILGFILGGIVVIFKTTLFFSDIDFTQTKYRYPGNAVFFFGVIYSSYLVAKKVSTMTGRLKKLLVFAIVSTQFFFGFLIAMSYRYLFVPWFNHTTGNIGRSIIAMITPILVVVPMVISENLALKSLQFTDAERIFVLVSIMGDISILLYCIMQAGVSSMGFFIALSLFRGILQVIQTATVRLRKKLATAVWACIERKCRLQLEIQDESNYHRRLKIDQEIQTMLYQNISIILSQAYLVLCLTGNYHVESRHILGEYIIKRVILGVGISFVANCFSIFLHVHWFKTQLTKVWYNSWRLHLLTALSGGVMTICYFTSVLLSVFEKFAEAKGYHSKDCTGPFT